MYFYLFLSSYLSVYLNVRLTLLSFLFLFLPVSISSPLVHFTFPLLLRIYFSLYFRPLHVPISFLFPPSWIFSVSFSRPLTHSTLSLLLCVSPLPSFLYLPLSFSVHSISSVFPSSVLQIYSRINKFVAGDKKTRQ